MKKKIFKLLSVVLALAMVLTTCVCAVSAQETTGGKKAVYYAAASRKGGMDSNDGLTAATPIATVEKAIQLGLAAGLGKGDVVTLYVDGHITWGGDNSDQNGINAEGESTWEVMSSHEFELALVSTDASGSVSDVAEGNPKRRMMMGGPMSFKDVSITAGSTWLCICFDAHPVTFDGQFGSDMFDLVLGNRKDTVIDEETTVNFYSFWPKTFVTNSYGNSIYNEDLNLNIIENTGSPNVSNDRNVILEVGPISANEESGTTTFNKGFNVTTYVPNKIQFSKLEKVVPGENGYFNVINNARNNTITLNDVRGRAPLKAKTWVINNIAIEGNVEPGEEAGEFIVPIGYIATATDVNGVVTTSADGELNLPAGQYAVDMKVCTAHEYDSNKDADCNHCGATREVADGGCDKHVFGEYTFNNDASCTSTGTEMAFCIYCGMFDIRNVEGKAPGHKYDNDCDADCNECGKERDVDHTYKKYKTTDATTSKNGKKYYECSVCGATKTSTIYKVSEVYLSTTEYAYNGETKKPSVKVYDSKGKKLTEGEDYKISRPSSSKKIGKYKIKVTFMGDYTGTKNLYYTIGPKNTSSVKATLYGYDDVKVTWKKVSGASGYKVYYKKSTSSSWSSKTTSSTSVKLSNLSDGKKYEIKVVAYKTVSGDKCYNSGKSTSIYTLKKITGVKASKSSSKVKVSWSNISGETGYQISKTTSKSKTDVVSTYKTTSGKSKTISATKGKTYYYKVRAYKTVDGKKIYGPWSDPVKYVRK